MRETCSFAGGIKGWSNKKSYVHFLFGPVGGTSRKQGLESLVTGKQGWCMDTAGCRQLTQQHVIIFGLFYFVPNGL